MTISREIFRKIFHLIATSIVVAFYYLGKENFAKLFIPITVLVVLADFSRCKFENIHKISTKIF
ncbi:MAG: hypothetical protein ACKO6C_03020, partial [Alphaproteobacteria bacterium]